MQPLDYRCTDAVKIESFFEVIDFPTEEELLAALDATLKQPPWLPRALSGTAENAAPRDLTYHGRTLNGETAKTPSPLSSEDDDDALAAWLEDPVSHQEITVEPDFLAALIKFLMERLTLRRHELSEAHNQLIEELAKLKR